MRATVHSFFAHHQRQRMVASGEQCRLSRAGISCNRRSQAKCLHVSHSYNKYTNIMTSLNWSLQSDAKRCSMRQVINITKAEPRSITVSYYPLGYAIIPLLSVVCGFCHTCHTIMHLEHSKQRAKDTYSSFTNLHLC